MDLDEAADIYESVFTCQRVVIDGDKVHTRFWPGGLPRKGLAHDIPMSGGVTRNFTPAGFISFVQRNYAPTEGTR